MQQKLSTLFDNSKYSKYQGVNGATVNIEQLYKENWINKDGINAFISKNQPYGTIGCYLSHINLWQHIYKTYKPTDKVLILEDDITFTDKNKNTFKKRWEYLTSHPVLPNNLNWDIIYYDHNIIHGQPINSYYIAPFNNAPPCHNALLSCYLVNVASIPKLLQVCLPIGRVKSILPIDGVLRHSFNIINALFYKDHIAKQNKKLGSCRVNINRRQQLPLLHQANQAKTTTKHQKD